MDDSITTNELNTQIASTLYASVGDITGNGIFDQCIQRPGLTLPSDWENIKLEPYVPPKKIGIGNRLYSYKPSDAVVVYNPFRCVCDAVAATSGYAGISAFYQNANSNYINAGWREHIPCNYQTNTGSCTNSLFKNKYRLIPEQYLYLSNILVTVVNKPPLLATICVFSSGQIIDSVCFTGERVYGDASRSVLQNTYLYPSYEAEPHSGINAAPIIYSINPDTDKSVIRSLINNQYYKVASSDSSLYVSSRIQYCLDIYISGNSTIENVKSSAGGVNFQVHSSRICPIGVTDMGNLYTKYATAWDANYTTLLQPVWNSSNEATYISGLGIYNNFRTIGDKAFSACTNLNTIYIAPYTEYLESKGIPNMKAGVNSIGRLAFKGTKLESIHTASGTSSVTFTLTDSVTSLGEGCFMNTLLKRLSVLNVKVIPKDCFTNTKFVEISNTSSYTSSVSSILKLPNTCQIQKAAFRKINTLTGANITCDSNETLQEAVFAQCSYITSITLNNAKTLGIGCFANCERLSNISGSNITTLNNYCLYNTQINTLPCSTTEVVTIKSYAVYSPTLNATKALAEGSVIETQAFIGCTSLCDFSKTDWTKVTLENGALNGTQIANKFGVVSIQSANKSSIVNDGKKYNNQLYTVCNASNTNMTLKGVFTDGYSDDPSGVGDSEKPVGIYLIGASNGLSTSIDDTVQSSVFYSFYQANTASNATTPNNSKIGNYEFHKSTVKIKDRAYSDNKYSYMNAPTLNITETVEGLYNKMSINNQNDAIKLYNDGKYTFYKVSTYSCTNLKYIGRYALSGMDFKWFYFPNSGNLEQIGTGAFQDCDWLTRIFNFEKQTKLQIIPDYAFSGCDLLDYILIPQNVKEIGNYAFYNNKKLSGFTSTYPYYGENVIKIGDHAFDGCNLNAEAVGHIINSKLTHIGSYAFKGYKSISNTTGAFGGYVQIPNTVNYIGNYAFTPFLDTNRIYIRFQHNVSQAKQLNSFYLRPKVDTGVVYIKAQNRDVLVELRNHILRSGASHVFHWLDFSDNEYTF